MNKFKNEFYDLIDKKEKSGYKFFEEQNLSLRIGKIFNVLKCKIDKDLLDSAMALSAEKSQYMMDENQAGIPRDSQAKQVKLAQGVLAEMFVHIFLWKELKLDVVRYDLERDSFKYNRAEEYDLKFFIKGKEYKVESRSSNLHGKSITEFIEKDCIIGPYTNSIKKSETYSNLHFRPMYSPEFPISLEGKIRDGSLYITGCATKEQFIKYGYDKSMGQRGTTYKVVDVLQSYDVKAVKNYIQSLFS